MSSHGMPLMGGATLMLSVLGQDATRNKYDELKRPPTPVNLIDDDDDKDLQVLAVKKVPKPPPPKTTRPKTTQIVDLTVESPRRLGLPSGNSPLPPTSDNNPNALKCSICLDNVSYPTSTICGHLFCEACIRLAVRQTGLCPTCRKKLTVKQIHRAATFIVTFSKGLGVYISPRLPTITLLTHMLFYTPRQAGDNSIAHSEWLEQLDLRRAYDKLQGIREFPVPWRPDASTLLGAVIAGRDSVAPSMSSFDDSVLESALRMHAGPIPGLDLSRFITATSGSQTAVFQDPSSTIKKRAVSEDVSRSGSPSTSDRSGAASPSTGSKKPRAQSIVRSTYYSSR